MLDISSIYPAVFVEVHGIMTSCAVWHAGKATSGFAEECCMDDFSLFDMGLFAFFGLFLSIFSGCCDDYPSVYQGAAQIDSENVSPLFLVV